ncbi:MAG TPA: 50S ribosomal protein L9 [Acidimicrobiales bacterium]
MAVKVILRSDIAGVGKRGDIVDVSDGYARNYLFPRGLGIKATDGAVAQASAMRRARDLRDAADRSAAEEIAKKLVATVITIPAKAGTEGRLFGSVTSADVVDAVETQTGISLDRKKVHHDPIKVLGTHTVAVRLHSDVEFPVTVEVVAS